jgi:hypothetical protein
MATENQNSQTYDLTEVRARVLADFRRSLIAVSLLANLTMFVTWLVVTVP